MTKSELLDKVSQEIIEEILSCPEGTPWFTVVRAKLGELAKDLKEKRRKP